MPSLGEKFGIENIPVEELPAESNILPDEALSGEIDLDDLSSFFEKTTTGLVQNALAGLTEEDQTAEQDVSQEQGSAEPPSSSPKADKAPATNGNFMTDYKELEALVAESTSNYVKTTLHGLSPVPYQPTVPQSTSEYTARTDARCALTAI